MDDSGTTAPHLTIRAIKQLDRFYRLITDCNRHVKREPHDCRQIITVLAEFLMWIVAGPLGVIIATPFAAAILTLIRTSYLHESPEKR